MKVAPRHRPQGPSAKSSPPSTQPAGGTAGGRHDSTRISHQRGFLSTVHRFGTPSHTVQGGSPRGPLGTMILSGPLFPHQRQTPPHLSQRMSLTRLVTTCPPTSQGSGPTSQAVLSLVQICICRSVWGDTYI